MGGGSFGEMAMGFAETDIGKKIGSVPQDAMQTSIQSDFTSKLKQLKLEKYKELYGYTVAWKYFVSDDDLSVWFNT